MQHRPPTKGMQGTPPQEPTPPSSLFTGIFLKDPGAESPLSYPTSGVSVQDRNMITSFQVSDPASLEQGSSPVTPNISSSGWRSFMTQISARASSSATLPQEVPLEQTLPLLREEKPEMPLNPLSSTVRDSGTQSQPLQNFTPLPEAPSPRISPIMSPPDAPTAPVSNPAPTSPPIAERSDGLGSWATTDFFQETQKTQNLLPSFVHQPAPHVPVPSSPTTTVLVAPETDLPSPTCEWCNGTVKNNLCEKCGARQCPHCKKMNYYKNTMCAYCKQPL